MWRFLIFVIFAASALAQEGAEKVYRWPKGFEGEQHLEVERLAPSEAGAVGFETANFRFRTDAEISKEDWRSIMIVCEGLRGAMRSLPLDLVRSEAATKRGEVRLFSKEEAYNQAGGLKGTVGTYQGRGGRVLIWTRGLNEPDPEAGSFRLSKPRQYDLLVHELAHQISGRELGRMPVWFSEGLAEYLAAAQFAPGRYSFKDPSTSIRDHVKKYLGDVAKQQRFEIVPLETVVRLVGLRGRRALVTRRGMSRF